MASDPTFHPFPRLPPELRLQIWSESFKPRVLQLHGRRAGDKGTGPTSSSFPAIQSRSYNPAALSVNSEARCAALSVYNATLPLSPEKCRGSDIDWLGNVRLSDYRVLYLALDRDTLVLQGTVPPSRVTRVMNWIRQQERGELYRICMSCAVFERAQAGGMLRNAARDLFYDVPNFGLAIGMNARAEAPPDSWEGSTCALKEFPIEEEHDGDVEYKNFMRSIGPRFREGDRWMVVGKKELRIVSLQFENGW